MAEPPPPPPQHVERSPLLQPASAQLTADCVVITQQLSEIDLYYSGWSSGKIESKEDSNRNLI